LALSEPPRLVWPGRYSDGRTAAFYPVEARVGEEGLAIAGESLDELWPCDDIRLIDEPDVSGTIRVARLGGDARLTLQHEDALRALEPRCRHLHAGMGGESSWRVIAIWSAAAAAAIAVLILGVIPFMAHHASQWVSPKLEAELGERLVGFVSTLTVAAQDTEHPECDAPRGRDALDKLVAPLAAELSLRNPVHVRVVNSKLLNAIALPGDQIVLFRGLIDFVQGPNEVAGVIAHEMGHLRLDHPMTLVIEQTGTAFVIGLMMGDIFGGSALTLAGTGLLVSAFSREAESAADAEAVTLMTQAGLDAAPFGAFFERLDARQGNGAISVPFLRTHPPSDQRAKLIEAAPRGGRQALAPAEWRDLKTICG
jgi:beta-barrel assembly-enhancing protease